MKRLVFEALRITRFREIENLTINFTKMGTGLHYVTGENKVDDRLGANGIGKSTIYADVLHWVLTGKTTRGLRNPDIRPWGSKEHAEASVQFSIGKRQAQITRSTKTNGLRIDDKLASQEDVDALVRLNETSLPYTLIFGQASPMFLDLTATKKMEVISETLRLDRFDTYAKRAKDKVIEIDGKVSNLQMLIRHTCQQIDTETEALASMRDRAVSWQKQAERDLDAGTKLLKTLEVHHEAAEVERGKHDLAHDSAETEARAARKNHQDLMEKVSSIERAKAKLDGQFEAVRSQIQKIDVSDKCPVCGGPMDTKHANKEIARLQKEADGYRSEAQRHHSMIKSMDKQLKAVSDSVRAFREKADDAKDAHTRAERRVSDLLSDIKVQRKLIESASAQNPYTALVKEKRTLIDTLRAENTKLTSKIKARQEVRAHFEYWVKGFKLVRLHLLEEFMVEVEAVAAMMLPASGLVGWSMQFCIERELKSGDSKMGLDVRCTKAGVDVSPKWEAWSGGEGQRLRIVGSRALAQALMRRAGVECALAIFDEPTRHLSREGVADMIDLLADCADDGGQIIYIDHQAVASSRFASIRRVIKTHDGVRINSTRQ